MILQILNCNRGRIKIKMSFKARNLKVKNSRRIISKNIVVIERESFND